VKVGVGEKLLSKITSIYFIDCPVWKVAYLAWTQSSLSLVSPRAGGHSYAAYGLGGTNGALVIDLQRINQISVDASSGEAVIGTGSRLGDIALSLNDQGGRALPHGVCPYVGLGGHASFGG
jgi:FAD/FMN-containing dehydrogenase